MARARQVIRQPVVRAPAEPNTGTLLLYAYKNFDRELFASLHQAGHQDLRSKHGAVLANLDPGGTRLTTLARRGKLGTSAMGELVDELEQLGYVERRPDPLDRRAKLVAATTRGSAVLDLAFQTIGTIEAGYARLLGQAGHLALREALTRLAESTDAPGAAPARDTAAQPAPSRRVT